MRARAGHDRGEAGDLETDELARKQEVVPQEVEPLEDPQVVRDERLLGAEADRQDCVREPGITTGSPVESRMRKNRPMRFRQELFQDRYGLGLRADQIDRQALDLAAGGPARRLLRRDLVGHLLFPARRRAVEELQPQPRDAFGARGDAERLERARRGEILGLDKLERPDRQVGGRTEPARDLPLRLPVDGIEVRSGRDAAPLPQGGIAEDGLHLRQQRRGCGREVVRDELFEQVAGEFGEFVLQLQLDAGGQERRALQHSQDHGIRPLFEQPARRSARLGNSSANSRPCSRRTPSSRL